MATSSAGDARPVATVVGDDEEPLRLPIMRAIVAGGGEVVGEATTGRMLLPLVERLQPRLVVLDLAISGVLGLSIVPRLLEAAPGAVLAVFDPLVVMRSVDLIRLRVLDKDDLRQLRGVVSDLAIAIAPEAGRARTHRPTS